MKNIIMTLAASLFMSCLAATAQTTTIVRSTSLTNGEMTNIDNAKYRITYEENKEFEFTAIGMSTLKTPDPITISKEKREEISQKDLRTAKEKFTPGMVLEGVDLKNVVARDEKGNPIDIKKFMNKKNVFNSIER